MGMNKTSILEYLKEVIDDMVDNNGNIKALPSGTTGRLNLSNNRLKFLADLINLVRNTDIINEETKIYINNRYISIRGANKEINNRLEPGKPKIKEGTTRFRVHYDKENLTKIFGESMFVDILSRRGDISVYERILAEQYVKYSGSNNYRDNLLIEIPENCMNSELDDDEFDEFLAIIAPYSRSQVEYIEDNLGERASGYFNYLISMPNLDGIHRQRLDRLRLILGIVPEKEE